MNATKFFTSAEQDQIERAVSGAEQKTAGEIVPMLVAASDSYAEVEMTALAFGLVFGTFAGFIIHDPWAQIHSQLLWPLAGAVLGFIPYHFSAAIKRRLVSKERIDQAVHLRSLAAFTEQGLHHTRAETGILIFVSLLEHRVVVLADRGINAKVQPGTWEEVVGVVTAGLKSGQASAAFCKAIERCGEILAQHFPRVPDDKDELSNRLVTDK
jgi:putative membrane protein